MVFRSLPSCLSIIFCVLCASMLSALTPVQRGNIQQLTKEIREGKLTDEQSRQRAQQLKVPEKQMNDFIVQQLIETAAAKGIDDIFNPAASTRTMAETKPAIAPRPVTKPVQPLTPTPGVPTPQAPVQPVIKDEKISKTKTPAPTVRKDILALKEELEGLLIYLTDKDFVKPKNKESLETFILAAPEMKTALQKWQNDTSINDKERTLINNLLLNEQPKLEKAAANAKKILEAAQQPSIVTKPIAMPLIDVYVQKTYSDTDIKKYTTNLTNFDSPRIDIYTNIVPLEIKDTIKAALNTATDHFTGTSDTKKAVQMILLPAYYRAESLMNILNQKRQGPNFQEALSGAREALEKFLELTIDGNERVVDMIKEFETKIDQA